MANWLIAVRRRWRSAFLRWRYYWDGRVSMTLLLVAVMVALLVGIWLGRWWIPDGSSVSSSTEQARSSERRDQRPETPSVRGRQASSTSVQMGRCQEVYAAQSRSLQSVGPAMTRWEVHIGAMNKLVVGAISLEQAQGFWDQTREGAARSLKEFNEAQRILDEETARCPVRVGRSSEELRGCASAVAARNRALDRAAVALDTWRAHVGHMEMLRRGEMSPEEATQLWLESWREGRREVEAYRSAAREARPVAVPDGRPDVGTESPCA